MKKKKKMENYSRRELKRNLRLFNFLRRNIMTIYTVIGYNKNEAQLMGCFSTEELARECGDELVEAEVVDRYEIEYPELDEFGYK